MLCIRTVKICNIALMTKNNEYILKLGNRIRELRINQNLTQMDLAARIGKDYQSLQRIESGVTNPTVQYLTEIAEGLNVSIQDLFEFENPKIH